MGRQKKQAGLMPRGRKKTMRVSDQARERISPAMGNARQRIGPAVDEAREKVGPVVEHARTVITDDVVPKVATAVSNAVTASEPYRTEAKRRGSAAYHALKGEVDAPQSRRKRRWPRVLLGLAALSGAAVAIYRLLKRGSSQQWQPMHSTTAPTQYGGASAARTDTPGGRPAATDEVGADPGEALADRSSTPSERTTPEDPAEHTEMSDTGKPKSDGGSVPQQSYGRERTTSEESKKRPGRSSGPTSRNTGPRGRPRSS